MRFRNDETIRNKTWRDLLHAIRRLPRGKWVFRAVDEPNKPVTSSFDDACQRAFGHRMSQGKRRLYESWMLHEFKREAHNYLTNCPERDDFLEWLALARHYEMPSRLVDFSYSFYVASYFALARKKNKEKGYVVAINHTWMIKQAEERLRNGWAEKYGIPFKEASFHNRLVFRKFAFKYQENYVVSVNSLRRNPRLARQKGLFLCPGNIKKPFETNLEATLEDTRNVKRQIVLDCRLRSEAIRDLREMNISLAALYPDLSGWAQSQRDLVHYDLNDIRFDDRFRTELLLALENPRM